MNRALKAASAAVLALAASAVMAQATAPAAKSQPAADPKVAECRGQNSKAHADLMAMHSKAKAEGKINATEEKQFHAMEQRLRTHQASLAKGGLTLPECQQLSKQLANEKAALTRMASSSAPAAPGKAHPPVKVDPKVAECRSHNAKEHSAVMAAHAKAKAEKKLTAAEEKEFASRQARLKQHQVVLNKGGLTLAECNSLGKEIAAEKAAVQRMAK